MNRFGLALSGGGFRAVLYHLGLIRFLRDAGILSRVTHICSVSGGSIVAAHLVLNWDRYNGSPGEFDAAAEELLSFLRLDVRNRIVRRFPLAFLLHWPRRLLGLSNRKLTRTGLLEYHYEQYLYGDTSLFELPIRPELHILATNLSEGCLCSFNRSGLMMVRRQSRDPVRLDRIHVDRIQVGLGTVPMAVTASSAFPGFFPPAELTRADVGAGNEFGVQAYTDGGVFDNLGVRMFRCLERPLLTETPLSRDDFFDFEAVVAALYDAGKSSDETAFRRLGQIMVAASSRPDLLSLPNGGHSGAAVLKPLTQPGQLATQAPLPSSELEAGERDGQDLVLPLLRDVLRRYQLHREPLFGSLKPPDPEAEALLRASRRVDRPLNAGDQAWLNRQLLEAAFRQARDRPCFRRLNSSLDGILVSDVGKRIEVEASRRAGGLIHTAMRATDIIWDRVTQLETDIFYDTPGFVFAQITDVVDSAEDSTALHPEIQRQAVNVRTDFDRFSDLEMSVLVRHGYCVGRKACRAHTHLFGADLPDGAPWDPIKGPGTTAHPVPAAVPGHGPSTHPIADTVTARTMQGSALRRVWSTLLDRRDWTSYIYVPLLVPILVMLPYLAYKSHQRSQRLNYLLESFSQGSQDFAQMSRLIEDRQQPWVGAPAEPVGTIEKADLAGFQILQDSRIFDLRNWKPGKSGKSDPSSLVFGYRRLKVAKEPGKVGNDVFHAELRGASPKTAIRFPTQRLQPKLSMSRVQSSNPSEEKCDWLASFDFTHVPVGKFVDLIAEFHTPGENLQRGGNDTVLVFPIRADTAEMTAWILMPDGKEYQSFSIVRYDTAKPEKVEAVELVTEYLRDDYTIIAFKLLSLKSGYTYVVSWTYR
jgi:predicted acylesterase/phospholipase RssA